MGSHLGASCLQLQGIAQVCTPSISYKIGLRRLAARPGQVNAGTLGRQIEFVRASNKS